MVRGKRILLLLFLCFVATALAVTQVHTTKTAYLPITDIGDTAKVMKINKFSARDSFDYELDVEDGTVTGQDSLVKWTSPLQVMRIIVQPSVDTANVYVCSLSVGAKYGFTYDIAGTDDTLANLVSNLVDSINAVAGMSDTLTAEDSVTYIKVISNFAQENLPSDARWTLILGDSLSKGDSTITTIAMVCDSLAATVNADIGTWFTGANDGDTVWTITGLKKGLNFTIDVADTSQDTATLTDTVTSRSGKTDTIPHIVGLHKRDLHANGLYMTVILSPSTDTGDGGIGKDDSCVIWVYTVFDDQSATGQYFLLDSSVSEGLPDTLRISIPRDSAGVDTLFKDWLAIVYRLDDSTTDTTFWPSYDVQVDLNVYSQ